MSQWGISKKKRKTQMIRSFFKEEDGQDLVEYSLILGFIALAAVALLTSVKSSINTLWTNVNTKLTTAASGK
jgi:Flp pilus assembly pilin Flp